MTMSTITRCAAALVIAATGAFAQSGTWARDLVDHELMKEGATEVLVAEWLDNIESDPGHVLVEPTLRLIERAGVVRDPIALGARLRMLDAGAMRPAARHVHERLVARDRVRRDDPVNEINEDLYPSVLSIYTVAGPLGPTAHALALEEPDERVTSPNFAATLEGLEGPVAWSTRRRSHMRGALDLSTNFDPNRGFALVAVRFVVQQGGPAWIEIDSGDAAMRAAGPSVAYSINGAEQQLVDRWRQRTPPTVRVPTVLRNGHNELVMKVALARTPTLAVRVMAPDGSPYSQLSQNFDVQHDGLSESVDAAPPSGRFPDAIASLEARGGERDDDETALLGVLHSINGNELEGLALLREAAERSGRIGHMSLLASFTNECRELPGSWRRSEARKLAEAVVAQHAEHLPMGMFLADIMVSEDRELEAIELLHRLTSANAQQIRSLLALRAVYGSLRMEAESEEAVAAAWARAPEHPTVMRLRADLLRKAGLGSEALELVAAAMRREGVTAGRLAGLSRQWSDRGETGPAMVYLSEAMLRGGDRTHELAFARLTFRSGQDEYGDRLLRALVRRYPRWVAPRWEQVLAAFKQGDVDVERAALERVLEVVPSHVPARRRLAVLTGEDPVDVTFDRFETDGAELLAEYSGGLDQDASVVRVLDHQIVRIERDGSMEVQTHEIIQPRDLNGCEAVGTVTLRGEVIDIATIKSDGTRFEPVRVNGEYVMPLLEPGDFIETIERDIRGSSADGLVRLGRWYFASIDQPFWLSRYVVSVPKDLDLDLDFGNFDGNYETIDEGDRVVHIIERRASERILPEPGMPPRDWFAPWVDIGQRAPNDTRALDALREPLLPLVRTSPQLRAAVNEVRTQVGDDGQEDFARALYARAVESVDQVDGRLSTSATQTLLSRAGSPSVLFAAMLDIAEIPYEFVWTRGVVPAGDPDPEPLELDPSWIGRRLFVVVRPDNGAEAWCDPLQRTLPYGVILRDAPGSEAFGTGPSGRFTVPDAPLEDRPGYFVSMQVELDAEGGGASVSGVGEMTGNLGFPFKEQTRNIPTVQHRIVVAQVAAAVMPGVDVETFNVTGLEESQAHLPLRVEVRGRVARFLDDDGTGLSCALPFPPLNLSAIFAGEGRRRLPLLLSGDRVDHVLVDIVVPLGLTLHDVPETTVVEFPRGSYELTVTKRQRAGGETIWTFDRSLRLGACHLEPADYAAFAADCARIDELERTRLRFTR